MLTDTEMERQTPVTERPICFNCQQYANIYIRHWGGWHCGRCRDGILFVDKEDTD